jgi:hypothetical protein
MLTALPKLSFACGGVAEAGHPVRVAPSELREGTGGLRLALAVSTGAGFIQASTGVIALAANPIAEPTIMPARMTKSSKPQSRSLLIARLTSAPLFRGNLTPFQFERE